MNDQLFISGLILLLIGCCLGMITPAVWCFIGDKNNKFTCCFPIIFNSTLIIIGVCLVVLGKT